jgi:hypothetical protein
VFRDVTSCSVALTNLQTLGKISASIFRADYAACLYERLVDFYQTHGFISKEEDKLKWILQAVGV